MGGAGAGLSVGGAAKSSMESSAARPSTNPHTPSTADSTPSTATDDAGKARFPCVPPAIQAKESAMSACLEDMKPKEPHWYVQILATAASYRGRRCASKLLDIVHEWALRDGVSTYLETDGQTAGFYEKLGFSRLWQEQLTGDESDKQGLLVVGLVRT